MKQPLPPSIVSALATVADISDRLAETLCIVSGPLKMDSDKVLNNLDLVASAVTLEELEQAPDILNDAARAFRQTFPADSLGWEHAGKLNHIAIVIEGSLPPKYKTWPDAPPRLTRLNSL